MQSNVRIRGWSPRMLLATALLLSALLTGCGVAEDFAGEPADAEADLDAVAGDLDGDGAVDDADSDGIADDDDVADDDAVAGDLDGDGAVDDADSDGIADDDDAVAGDLDGDVAAEGLSVEEAEAIVLECIAEQAQVDVATVETLLAAQGIDVVDLINTVAAEFGIEAAQIEAFLAGFDDAEFEALVEEQITRFLAQA